MKSLAIVSFLQAALRCTVALLMCGFASLTQADVFRPAYLELREAGQDEGGAARYDVMWKRPVLGESRLALQIRFPQGTTQLREPQGVVHDDAYIERWQVSRPGGFVDQTISIDGIIGGVTDVIVRIERSDGTSQVERLLPQRPQFTVEAATGTAAVAWSYLVLGIEHILGGIDHLLFVLALLLIVRGGKKIFMTITAFTIAHSITLVSATMGWVHVPGPPLEAIIALSIVYVAAEIVRGLRGHPGLTARAPWIVAFSFGLLHGFGFAGALAEVGLPQKAVPLALLTFNVGVEAGQLMFVAIAVGARAALNRLPLAHQKWVSYPMPYAIGGVAMFWVIERVIAFF
jgi:hydrogenase/urease accessory protein HupE